MKLVELEQTTGEKLWLNPSFIAAVWPSGKPDCAKLSINAFPGDADKTQKTVKGSPKDVAGLIDAALKD